MWVGYPGTPRPMYGVEGVPEMFGGTIPTEIWHDVMANVTRGMAPLDWAAPPPPKTGTVPSVIGQLQGKALKTLSSANFSGIVDGSRPSTQPAGTGVANGAVKLALPEVSVVTGAKPRNFCPSPKPVGSAVGRCLERAFELPAEKTAWLVPLPRQAPGRIRRRRFR